MEPAARRDQILASALAVFSETGLSASSHADVARAAGVALPTVFHYFPTKPELREAAFSEVSRFLLEEIVGPHFETDLPAPESIERILMTFCDAIESHPYHVRIWLEWSVSIRAGLWDRYRVFYRAALEAIGQILARGAREGSLAADLVLEDAARVVVGLAHMIVQMRFSGSEREQVDHTVHSLVRRYLQR